MYSVSIYKMLVKALKAAVCARVSYRVRQPFLISLLNRDRLTEHRYQFENSRSQASVHILLT